MDLMLESLTPRADASQVDAVKKDMAALHSSVAAVEADQQ